MNQQEKKLIAPIVITILLVLYYFFYFGVLLAILPGGIKLVLGLIPLALAAVSIFVCIERVREITGGEEDDLSQY